MLTVEFTLAGGRYLGLNGGAEKEFQINQGVSFRIHCKTQAEVDRLWNALKKGGKTVWCGWLRDRWGLTWQIVPTRLTELMADPDPERARRTMGAMMTMEKNNIAKLGKAADGK